MREPEQSGFWRTRFRLIQPNLRKIDARALDIEGLVAQIADCGANAALINGGGILAWYPTQHPYQAVNDEMAGDFLGRFLEAAHARGLKVLVRMDVSKGLPHAVAHHPDWFRRRPDGSLDTQWDLPLTCPTGPVWQTYNFEVVGELLRRYPIDGFFYNHYRFDHCCCQRCREEFMAATGYELPVAEDWDDPAWRAFVEYRYRRVAEYTRRLDEYIRRHSPNAVLTVDTRLTNDRPQTVREAGWDPAALARATGCITVEAFNVLERPQPKWIYWAGEEVALGSHLGNTCVILTYSEVFGSRRAAQPPVQLGYDLMQIAAHGGAPAVALSGTFLQDDRKALPIIRQTLRFLAEHEAEYQAMQPLAEVGIVYSQRSLDFYGRDAPSERWQAHYRGAYEALAESHIPFTVLHDAVLTEQDLSAYRCLVLPNVACLSDRQAEILDAYVEGGGHLIATFETGRYAPDGSERPGGEIALHCLGRTVVRRQDASGAYFWIGDSDDLLHSFADTDLLALGGGLLVTRPIDERPSSTPLRFIPPVTNNTPEFAYWESVGEEPGLVLTAYGRGTAAYLPWWVDRLYHQHGVPEYRQLLTELVDRATGPRLVDTNAPAAVQLTLARRPAGGRLLHLLNATGHQSKPQAEVVTLADVWVRVRGRFGVVRSLVSGLHLAAEITEGATMFVVGRLGLYEAIVLEQEEQGV
jgi:Hypothetical glycosyl hydrolase 6/Beta-galactosidase trimerisation domain